MTRRIVLCLVACLGIASIACSRSLDIPEIVTADRFILATLSNLFGTDSRFKSLFHIQNAAYRMSESRTPFTTAFRDKLLKMLKVAANAENTEKVNELTGKLFFVMNKIESNDTIEKIIEKYGNATPTVVTRRRRSLPVAADIFGPVYKHLLKLDGGVTLIFAIDTTGSMSSDIVESKQIATDIVNRRQHSSVTYILSPFNDPGTGPVTFRDASEKNLILKDIDGLNANGGGDCPELAYKGMLDSLDYGHKPGSSMFVFTDAAPKDGTPDNVQDLIDMASFDDMKISFFLNRHPCGSISTINTYHKVAKETGGTVFTFQPGSSSGRRKKRALSSAYSAFVTSSLRGTSLIKSKPAGTAATMVNEAFDIDDEISFVTVVVVAPSNQSPSSSVSLIDSTGKSHVGITASNAIAMNIDSPVTGNWKLSYPGTHSYTISVAFKTPIAIDVRYFFPERNGALMMVSRPMKGMANKMMINMAGREKVNLMSVNASLLNSTGGLLSNLQIVTVKAKDGMKLSAKFTPPNVPYRVQVNGVTKTGYAFERLTNNLIRAALVVFKTVRVGDEYSVAIGSKRNRLIALAFVKSQSFVTAKFNVHAKLGNVTVRGGTGSLRFRRRKVLFIGYDAPTDTKHKGRSEMITINVEYNSEITTHRLLVLLL